MKLIRIVPAPVLGGKATSALGTKFYAADGGEISGVTSVTLTASVDEPIWKASIECFVRVDGDIVAEAEGNLIEVTCFGDECRRFVKSPTKDRAVG